MKRYINRHYKTSYPNYDGMNAIYRVNVGADYLAQTTWWRHNGTNIISEADININMYYPYANSAQPGKFDTWTVFIHEAGHVIGLNHSEYTEAVMAPSISAGVTKKVFELG